MVKDVIIEIPLVNQNKDIKDKKWNKNACAICSMKMMMGFSPDFSSSTKGRDRKIEDPRFANRALREANRDNKISVDVNELINEAYKMGGYLEGIGWKHKTLTKLAKKYGVKLGFIRKFPKTFREKSKWLKKLENGIVNGKPAMASIYYRLNKKNRGHVVVVNGVRKNGKITLGYHIQDPDNCFKGNNYYISKDKFLLGWRGGMIYFAK